MCMYYNGGHISQLSEWSCIIELPVQVTFIIKTGILLLSRLVKLTNTKVCLIQDKDTTQPARQRGHAIYMYKRFDSRHIRVLKGSYWTLRTILILHNQSHHNIQDLFVYIPNSCIYYTKIKYNKYSVSRICVFNGLSLLCYFILHVFGKSLQHQNQKQTSIYGDEKSDIDPQFPWLDISISHL